MPDADKDLNLPPTTPPTPEAKAVSAQSDETPKPAAPPKPPVAPRGLTTNSDNATHSPSTHPLPGTNPTLGRKSIPVISRIVGEEVETAQVEQETAFACPNCGQESRPGELACSRCGYVFSAVGRTHKIADVAQGNKTTKPAGAILNDEGQPVTFEIGRESVTIVINETLVVGRGAGLPDDLQPGLDLTRFGAEEMGVSRRHLRLRRRGTLIYVSDMSSTNGTQLNGRKLIPDGERLIRNGDELRLGQLVMRVKF
jgi:predicted RNA-binding Zn-ribbon protein involved in translation (DUF1610 family)